MTMCAIHANCSGRCCHRCIDSVRHQSNYIKQSDNPLVNADCFNSIFHKMKEDSCQLLVGANFLLSYYKSMPQSSMEIFDG
eukprot:UN12007